jgi:hypothetical protein
MVSASPLFKPLSANAAAVKAKGHAHGQVRSGVAGDDHRGNFVEQFHVRGALDPKDGIRLCERLKLRWGDLSPEHGSEAQARFLARFSHEAARARKFIRLQARRQEHADVEQRAGGVRVQRCGQGAMRFVLRAIGADPVYEVQRLHLGGGRFAEARDEGVFRHVAQQFDAHCAQLLPPCPLRRGGELHQIEAGHRGFHDGRRRRLVGNFGGWRNVNQLVPEANRLGRGPERKTKDNAKPNEDSAGTNNSGLVFHCQTLPWNPAIGKPSGRALRDSFARRPAPATLSA